jgi:2-methylaconitate cis-trans-isomerase PrpF
MTERRVSAVYMRGGTSKAAIFLASDVPTDAAERDRMLLALYGSPDPTGRQLNGIGGGSSSTSKSAIVSVSSDPDADVDYLFAQVGIETAIVDLRGNCGNISAAIGPFAIDEGLVEATDRRGSGVTTVRIRNLNTNSLILAQVPTRDGRFEPNGTLAIAGVPGTGSAIRLDFEDPAGAVTGSLLPSGAIVDELDDGDGKIEATLIDAANPVVFVRAADLGLDGDETLAQLSEPALVARIAAIRAAGAVRMGMIADVEHADRTPAVPRVALVSAPRDYVTRGGDTVSTDDVDVVASMFSMGRPHAAYPFTGAIATAVASRITGSLVQQLARPGSPFRLGHPAGVQHLDAEVEYRADAWHVSRVSSLRTARRLMTGELELPCTPNSAHRTALREGEK